MKIRISVLLLIGWVIFSGCAQSALLRMRQDNREAERRIAVKNSQLKQLEAQNRDLSDQKERLLSELNDQQMTAGTLDKALQQLREQNARTIADTQIQKRRKKDLERQCSQYQKQLEALNESEMSINAKQARLQELKDTIKKYLTLDLAQ